MIDIQNELYHIRNDVLGEDVRSAIHDAANKVSSALDTDITSELAVIKDGRYGIDIRNAIYEALNKVSKASPSPVSSDVVAGFTIPLMHGTVNSRCGLTTIMEV